jgi:hypothetical protein
MAVCAAVNRAMMAGMSVFLHRSLNKMAGFKIGPLFTGVPVIWVMSIVTVVTFMAVIFGALVRPFMILIFFIVVPVCFLPLVLLMGRFVQLGNSGLLLFGFFVAPIVFAVRPCRTGKHKNTRCRQDTK